MKKRQRSPSHTCQDWERYESETSNEECGQGNVPSSRDSSTNNEEETNGEEEPITQSTRIKSNTPLPGLCILVSN